MHFTVPWMRPKVTYTRVHGLSRLIKFDQTVKLVNVFYFLYSPAISYSICSAMCNVCEEKHGGSTITTSARFKLRNPIELVMLKLLRNSSSVHHTYLNRFELSKYKISSRRLDLGMWNKLTADERTFHQWAKTEPNVVGFDQPQVAHKLPVGLRTEQTENSTLHLYR